MTLSSEKHFEKAYDGIFFNFPSIFTDLRPSQPLKASSPISVTEAGMVILVKPVQPLKAYSSISVTELGMTMLVRPVLSLKASHPIFVTELGITVFLQPAINSLVAVLMIALQLSRESNFLFPSETSMLVSPVQPPKALTPISVTELGMTMLVSPVQPSKALFPISVTELEIGRASCRERVCQYV